jgi:Protein of unknown function (DUF2911)
MARPKAAIVHVGAGRATLRIMPRYCTARRLCLSVSLLFVVAATTVPAAQEAPKIKPSQHGSVSQRIADTTIALEYNRPVARGRELFGALVPYGKIWCPCADDATTIELSTSVKIDGHDLAAGKYSVWTIPNDGKWTVIFNRRAATWHTRYPDGQDALRLEVATRQGSHMETLAFYFPAVDGKKAELVFHWGTTIVPLAIEVP